MQPDIEPKTNRTQCAITRLYDEGFDLHIVHGGTAGMLDTQTGTLIPMFKESDGFWYTYYVLAKTIKDTETAAQASVTSRCHLAQITVASTQAPLEPPMRQGQTSISAGPSKLLHLRPLGLA